VITTTGTPWNGLHEQNCGWWVEPDADALATALAVAMSVSPSQLQAMGRRGREWGRAEFSWELIGQRMRQAYERLFDHTSQNDWMHRTERKVA